MVNKIVVFKEYGGTKYFDASTPELLNKAFATVVNSRLKTVYPKYGLDIPEFNPTPAEQAYLDLTEEQINTLPEQVAEITRNTKRKLEYRKESILLEEQRNRQWFDNVIKFSKLTPEQQLQETILNRDGTPILLGKWILDARKSFSGESYEICELEKV